MLGSSPFCASPAAPPDVAGHTIELFDSNHGRRIPARMYHPGPRRPLALVLPGVGARPGDYSSIAGYLAKKGFAVAELQLELPGDPPIPNAADVAALRRPELTVNVESVRYFVSKVRELRYANTNSPAVLVGHSNGGDVAMLYGSQHPSQVRAIFSLDNLRVPIPRVSRPHICSIRSNNQKADKGVVPSPAQARAFNMRIEQTRIRHEDMWNAASEREQKLITAALDSCLSDK
ncbi:MAG TPA: alpha/beta hydrolase [Bradyrhizobium sp.]|nr:alpha/beta hydrolase [Bradyrhizobium sp.]HKO69958.1 alpha/beta hydrolase [Bradyrhizobium sp.]